MLLGLQIFQIWNNYSNNEKLFKADLPYPSQMDALEGIVDDKTLRILDLFMKNPEKLYHINKVSKDSKVPLATTFRIIKRLNSNDIIESVEISKFRIYKLSQNRKTQSLGRLK